LRKDDLAANRLDSVEAPKFNRSEPKRDHPAMRPAKIAAPSK
jgi:hypothetical protein